MTEPKQHGKFGGDRHFELVKKALIHAIDRYWEAFGTIVVENATISMHAGLYAEHIGIGDFQSGGLGGGHDLHPDIVLQLREKEESKIPERELKKKAIIIECETTPDGLLKDELRLTAYKLLRMRTPDRNKLMMYIALPSELRGKVEKPECFNDLLFFGLQTGNGGKK